jgi:hypothetical protein
MRQTTGTRKSPDASVIKVRASAVDHIRIGLDPFINGWSR